MFTYINNIILDIYYGYIEVKCCNKSCNNKFKFSRNKFQNVNYSCNMGCALNAYNNFLSNEIDNKYS
jgi:hypothetical protein